jgi:hypothetical protein
MGPFTYVRHLLSGSRLPFTAAYFGSIGLTLYFAVGVSLWRFVDNTIITTFYTYPISKLSGPLPFVRSCPFFSLIPQCHVLMVTPVPSESTLDRVTWPWLECAL